MRSCIPSRHEEAYEENQRLAFAKSERSKCKTCGTQISEGDGGQCSDHVEYVPEGKWTRIKAQEKRHLDLIDRYQQSEGKNDEAKV